MRGIVFCLLFAVLPFAMGACGLTQSLDGYGAGSGDAAVDVGGDVGAEVGAAGSDARGGGGAAATGGGETGGAGGVAGGGLGGGETGGAGGVAGGGVVGGGGQATPDACTRWPTDESECHPVKQCGCENKGTKTACKVVKVDGTAQCMNATTPEREPGRSCSGFLECAGGTCRNGGCGKYCATNADCGKGGRCLPLFMAEMEVDKVGTCTHQCQPWNGDGCGTGLSCDVPDEDGGLLSGASVCSKHPGNPSIPNQECTDHGECPVCPMKKSLGVFSVVSGVESVAAIAIAGRILRANRSRLRLSLEAFALDTAD